MNAPGFKFYTTGKGYKARLTGSLLEYTMQSYVKQQILIFSFPTFRPILLVFPAKKEACTQTGGVESVVLEEANRKEEMPVLSPHWEHDVPLDLRTSGVKRSHKCCQ